MYPIQQKDNSDMFSEINSQIINTLESNNERNSTQNFEEKIEITKANAQQKYEELKEKSHSKATYINLKEEVKHFNCSSKKSNSVISSYANYSIDKQSKLKCENKDNIITKASNIKNLHLSLLCLSIE